MRGCSPQLSEQEVKERTPLFAWEFPLRPSTPLWNAKKTIGGKIIGDVCAALYMLRTRKYDVALRDASQDVFIELCFGVLDLI
jgi:hypothetical protein